MRGQGDIAQYSPDARPFVGKLRRRDSQSLTNNMVLAAVNCSWWLDRNGELITIGAQWRFCRCAGTELMKTLYIFGCPTATFSFDQSP
jgi:hypothetical protein